MEYKKIINLLDNTPNQPTKLKIKTWVEINDDSRGTYNTNSQVKFKTSMLMLSLRDYSDAYILVSGTITVAALAVDRGNDNIKVVFKNCAPFTNCISEINNTQIDNANDIDVEYSNNYSKTSGSLWQYYRYEPALNNAGALVDFPGNSASFKFKQKITGSTGNDGKKAVQIMLPLKYSNNFWRAPEMPLINCEINLILTRSANCVISKAAAKTFNNSR